LINKLHLYLMYARHLVGHAQLMITLNAHHA